jgi:hypothetical protein
MSSRIGLFIGRANETETSNNLGAGDEYPTHSKRPIAAPASKKSKKKKDESHFPFLDLPGE